jgi:maltose alpha-D-glucosyltransferase/alpha-amylase
MPWREKAINKLSDDPLWYKDAVIYQLHIRAFYDSNSDGIGDFRGLIQKLDYMKTLGVNAIWLLPFYPSPLKDDGYDISDYRNIHAGYGTLEDFRVFINAAHSRGIRVITELVINHTSDQHEWFQRARRAPMESEWRNFYVWSDDPNKYKEVRIIFRDFELSNWTYDPVAKSYYWHRFYSHQPDLNFDNPAVRKHIFQLVDYWMKTGVDGMRLDAVPYLFEREGTSCENLPETHAFLKEMRAYIDKNYPNRMLLAEANQWPEDAVTYFGDGDECQMNFHFPIMPRLFMSVRSEDRQSIINIMRQTPEIPENCQWAMFLRNHDELTLEMMTDEERDFMYSAYATDERARINLGIRRRLAPLLNNDRRQIELLNGLLFSMPGTPIIYYGDEIGMGDNIYLGDRNGVRTPFQWSSDRNAGFSNCDPQKLFLPAIATPEYHYTTVNVETQLANHNSLLHWMRRLIDLRRHNIALARGIMNFLEPANEKVLAFTRVHEDQTVLAVANLSKRAQYVELDLSQWEGSVPIELRGDTDFPRIGKLPYLITLGPYDFFWFDLTSRQKFISNSSPKIPSMPGNFLTNAAYRHHFESMLMDFLPRARWFSCKDNKIKAIAVRDIIRIGQAALVLVDVQYRGQKDHTDLFLLSVSIAEDQIADDIIQDHPELVIGQLDKGDKLAIYYDAVGDRDFCKAMLQMLLKHQKKPGQAGILQSEVYKKIPKDVLHNLAEPKLMNAEQSNTSILFGRSFFFKLFRRLEEGINPEIEIGSHVTKAGIGHVPHMVGSLTYRIGSKGYSIAVLQDYVESKSSAWRLFQDHLMAFAEIAKREGNLEGARRFLDEKPVLGKLKSEHFPSWFTEATQETRRLMTLLGQRTAEIHLALGNGESNPAFRAEDITPFYQRSLYQSLKNRSFQTRRVLQRQGDKLPVETRAVKDKLLSQWDIIDRHFDCVRNHEFGGKIIRIHGDYHLGQVLFNGRDFYILDFEGEPKKPLSIRRLKRSPLTDVAGMVRSIDYSIRLFLTENPQYADLADWMELWRFQMDDCFMAGYLDHMKDSGFLPANANNVRYMTEALVLDKALYEVEYELGSRPDWVHIPLQGIIDILPTLSCLGGASDD